MSAAIELMDIGYGFEQPGQGFEWILRKFNFRVDEHQFVTIVGPSGCGKSTLLRLISGLVQPCQGTVKVKQTQVIKPVAKIGFVFQKPTLLPWCSALDNILFPVKHSGARVTHAHRDRALGLLQRVGLASAQHKLPFQLSGGMQQKIAIARALMLDPDLLLMDEPFSALDALSRERLGEEVKNILRETGKTVVLVSHSIPEAVALSDKVAVLSHKPARLLDLINIQLPPAIAQHDAHSVQFTRYCDQIRGYIFSQHSGEDIAL